MSEVPLRKAWLLLGFGFVALVVYLSLTPNPIDTGRLGEIKIGHFIAYAWLVLWFSQLVETMIARWRIWAAFALLGVLLEYVQAETGYRGFAYEDMRDNALGAAAGLALAFTPLGAVLQRLGKIRA
jgi:hypothetical protein